jgi:plasmid stabilization system protein ParE
MTYRIILQPAAEADVERIVDYLFERSPDGAVAWCKVWDKLLAELRQRPETFALAPESSYYEEQIRQALFKTRRGRTYHALFVVGYDTVHLIHVRGPGQDLVPPDDLNLP